MEAKNATDCQPWRDGIDPRALNRVSGAIAELAEFPVLDATVMRILRLCDDVDTTAADLVDALEQDPTFAANLLRYCNSAAAANPVRAKTVRQAVMLVGRRALRRLAMEAATFRFLERSRGNGRVSFGQMHLHAITVATGAVTTAEEAKLPSDVVHLAGLIHDVGKLVLPQAFGEEACDMIARKYPSGGDRVMMERQTFGIDHAQCGALLADAWGMDDEVVSLIAWHHGGPTGVSVPTVDVACVQVADCVAAMLHGDDPDHLLLETALSRLDLSVDVLDVLADRVVHADQGTAAGRLSERVEELERLTRSDEVTGLANRRHWLQTARNTIHATQSGAILLLDIDNFRQINERFGSAAADNILHSIGQILARHGHAGRIGSDAFGLLADGDLATVGELAQRVVAQVQESFEAGTGAKVDVSIGCAAAPYHGLELADLLEAADMALVDAKRAGRSKSAVAGLELVRDDQFAA